VLCSWSPRSSVRKHGVAEGILRQGVCRRPSVTPRRDCPLHVMLICRLLHHGHWRAP